MNEIPGLDTWGFHVHSSFKCSNPQCENESQDLDEDFHKKVSSSTFYFEDYTKINTIGVDSVIEKLEQREKLTDRDKIMIKYGFLEAIHIMKEND